MRSASTRLLCPLCVALAAAVSAPSASTQTSAPQPHQFTAQWISATGAPAHEPAVLRLRKELTLAAVPAHFVVHVSADNQFLLLVNGHRIGQGPSIGDLPHWRYQTYDLASALHAGSNVIAATVWNLADEAPIRQMTSRLGFLIDPDTQAEAAAATSVAWLAHQDLGFQFLPKPAELREYYYVGSPGERLDGAALDWSWAAPGMLDPSQKWAPAVAIGSAIARGNQSESVAWQLVPDHLPAMEFTPDSPGHVVRSTGIADASRFPAAPVEVPAHTTATLLLDRGTLTTAFPTLTLSAGKGAHVTLRYAEALIDEHGDRGNRNQIEGKHLIGVADELLPDGTANRQFTPLDWRTWRYLAIDITTAKEPLRLDSLTTTFTAFPFEQRARFSSDDPGLADVWQVGWRTARLCAHDAYMDTPYWERLQYVGDTRIQTLISYTNAGDDRLARQAISAFHDSLLPEGIGQSRFPSRHLQVITNFSMLWIGMVHDFWFFRNDPEFVRGNLPAIRSELAYFRERRTADGLPALREWWPFVDWATGFPGGDSPATPDGVNASASLFYLEALRNAADLERGLGNPDLARDDAAEADRLSTTIYRRFWSPAEQLLADVPADEPAGSVPAKHFSQQANALAVWLDVIPRAQQAELMTRLLSASDHGFTTSRPLPKDLSLASNYFRFYVARALVHAGLGDRYIETLAPWRTMLANGLTTWAEQPEPTRSDSHAWSAHPNIDLLTTVAGITPGAPGFASVEITPSLGPLHRLAVSYPSPRGIVTVAYTVTASGVNAQLDLPAKLAGRLHWNGKTYPLQSGSNTITLPPRRIER